MCGLSGGVLYISLREMGDLTLTHAKMATDNLTCIDCCFGIAHTELSRPEPGEIKLD